MYHRAADSGAGIFFFFSAPADADSGPATLFFFFFPPEDVDSGPAILFLFLG